MCFSQWQRITLPCTNPSSVYTTVFPHPPPLHAQLWPLFQELFTTLSWETEKERRGGNETEERPVTNTPNSCCFPWVLPVIVYPFPYILPRFLLHPIRLLLIPFLNQPFTQYQWVSILHVLTGRGRKQDKLTEVRSSFMALSTELNLPMHIITSSRQGFIMTQQAQSVHGSVKMLESMWRQSRSFFSVNSLHSASHH